MKRFSHVFVLCYCLAVCVQGEKLNYKGHKLYHVTPDTQSRADTLELMREQALLNLDFWSSPHEGDVVPVHVAPEVEQDFLEILDFDNIPYKVVIDDIEKLVDDEQLNNTLARTQRSGSPVGVFARTHEIHAWMDGLAERYDSFVSVTSIGKSYEGRDLKVMKLNSGGVQGKPAIFLDSGIHAREWISHASLIWIIDKMVTTFAQRGPGNTEIKRLIDRFDWYFFPVFNPDGYEYTHDHERFWRKTRSKHTLSPCFGVDPNRNFDYPKFGGPSTSTQPCSDIYKGPKAFSEPETRAFADYIQTIPNIKMYFAIHSFSQLWLRTWGYTKERPDDWEELDRVGRIGAEALYAVNKKTFKVGSPADLLYTSGGACDDWAKGVAGIKYSYTLELRPASGGINGFIVNPKEIGHSGEELLAGITASANAIHI